jgi:hypothetical protein
MILDSTLKVVGYAGVKSFISALDDIGVPGHN